jgi:hypothetical protein
MSPFLRTAFAVNGRRNNLIGPGTDCGRRNFLRRSVALAVAALPTRTFADMKGIQVDTNDQFATLSASCSTGSSVLHLDYFVTNRTNSEMFVFNRLYDDVDDHGNYRVGKDVCNVEISDRQIIVSKKISPVPRLLLVETANIPCVSAIPAGGTASEAIELRVPLSQWTPYAQDAKRNHVESLPLFFEIGYFIGQHGTRSLAKQVPTTVGPALRFAPFPVSSQHVLRVGPIAKVDVYIGDY